MVSSIFSLLIAHYTLVISFLVGALVHKGWQTLRAAVESKWSVVLTNIKSWKLLSWLK